MVCTPNRRATYKRNRHKTSCWRNPFVVFFISFLALGSLRFRVPERSKKAATILLQKRREKRRKRMKEGVDSTMNTDRKIDAHISYDLVEEVKDAKKRPFQKYKALLGDDGEPASVQQWATILAAANDDDPAIVLLNKAIASSPYQAVFFETPPVVGDSALSQQFQFVLVDAPQLHNAASENPDANTFATHMQTVDSENGVVFSNLGRDAILIAPKPLAEGKKCYSHLAPFVRTAPAGQVAAVWKMAAQAYLEHFSQRKQKPVWFSTSGLGIYWLHFRLDSVPKYYTYEPYKLLSR